jgi:septal ring factor EnvC (AmiA/AmiB activator)
VIAILAGAGVIAVGHFKVRPHIEGIIEQRNTNAKERDNEKAAKVKALKELKETTATLKKTERELGDTQTQLTATKKQADDLQKKANETKAKLDNAEEKLTESNQKLARWEGTGIQPEQVKGLVDSEKNLRANNDVLKDELKILTKVNQKLTNMIAQITNPNDEPALPAGLKGKVLVVDPKWNFVLLDIGEKQGVLKYGVLMFFV